MKIEKVGKAAVKAHPDAVKRIKENSSLSLLDKVEALQALEYESLSQDQRIEMQRFITEQAHIIRCQTKWLDLGLSEAVLRTAPDCVDELISSHIAHFIVLFRAAGHDVTLDHNDHPFIKMNGIMTPWDEIKACIEFNKEKECFVSKRDPNLSWTYICPDGFVQKEPYPTTLYPICTLKQDELAALQAHAAKFWESHPEVDPGLAKPCVLQIFSSRIDTFSRNWFTENYLDLAPRHVGIRLIDSTGKLYSFGLQINKQFREFISRSPSSILATGRAQVVVPDFYETHIFNRRMITSIPLTNERMQNILHEAGLVNMGPGEHFCQLRPNCLSFAIKMAKLAGVEIDCKMSVSEMILTAIPVIGKVYQAALPLLNKINLGIVGRVAGVVRNCCLGLLMIARGACQNVEEGAGRRLIGSLSDLLLDHTQQCDQVFKLHIWQQRYKEATKTYFYRKIPTMNVL